MYPSGSRSGDEAGRQWTLLILLRIRRVERARLGLYRPRPFGPGRLCGKAPGDVD
jgi:hypothetical protein